MPIRNIDLTSHLDHFVEEQVASGRFKNASDVMRAGLRLLEQQTAEDRGKLAALQAMATQAFVELDRGEGTVIDGSTDLEQRIKELGRDAASELAPTAEWGIGSCLFASPFEAANDGRSFRSVFETTSHWHGFPFPANHRWVAKRQPVNQAVRVSVGRVAPIDTPAREITVLGTAREGSEKTNRTSDRENPRFTLGRFLTKDRYSRDNQMRIDKFSTYAHDVVEPIQFVERRHA